MGFRAYAGRKLADYLTQPVHARGFGISTNITYLSAVLQPGDVLLVEGITRVSSAIKYLTQSTWSHAALFVGQQLHEALGENALPGHTLIEADVKDGVRSVPLSAYAGLHTRICRPVGLTSAETRQVCSYAITSLGDQYDLRNMFDLARYLLPEPPVPRRFRRQLMTLGSGDPTRAICSTLIAKAFYTINYPILPNRSIHDEHNTSTYEAMRHASLFAPRDFDVSPYFSVIKPTIEVGFNFHENTGLTALSEELLA